MNRNPCATCAFGAAGAAKEPYNAIRAEVCAAGAVPFWCHHDFDWRSRKQPERSQLIICAGWQEKIRKYKAQGRYADPRRGIRYWIAQNTLLWIEVLAGNPGPDDHAYALRQIEHGIKLLAQVKPAVTR